MSIPNVSIIMPIYNSADFLHESLGGLLKQTLTDIEIICVNDGSTDNSLDIIKEYAYNDSRIKIINKSNSGYGNTMNLGLKMATGEYIGILEPDDFADTEMFEKLYLTAKKFNVDVVKANYFEYSQKNNSNTFYEVLYGHEYNKIVSADENEFIVFLRPCIWTAIYRRQFLMDNNITFNETPGASYQDTAFAFKVWVSNSKVVFLKEAYLHYRIDNDNSSVKSTGKIFSICDEFQSMHAYLNLDLNRKKQFSKILQVLKLDSYNWNLQRIAPEYKELFKDQMALEFIKADYENVLDRDYFDVDRWKLVQSILDDYKFKNHNKELENRIKQLENSHSYKIGHMLMYIPGKVKQIFAK